METFQNGGQRLYKEQKRRFTNALTSQLNTPFRIPLERKHLSPDVYICLVVTVENET